MFNITIYFFRSQPRHTKSKVPQVLHPFHDVASSLVNLGQSMVGPVPHTYPQASCRSHVCSNRLRAGLALLQLLQEWKPCSWYPHTIFFINNIFSFIIYKASLIFLVHLPRRRYSLKLSDLQIQRVIAFFECSDFLTTSLFVCLVSSFNLVDTNLLFLSTYTDLQLQGISGNKLV